MTQSSPLTTHAFLELFDKFNLYGFEKPTLLRDTKIGFSIQKPYPDNIGYKPAKTKNGQPDNIATLWVVYDEKLKVDHLIPIRVRAAVMSRYRINNNDYDFTDEDNCPTEDSILVSRKSIQPLDVSLVGNYFYNLKTHKFEDAKGMPIEGVDILNEVFEYHCRTSHPINGLGIRLKSKLPIFTIRVFDKIIDFIEFLLISIFGRTLDPSIDKMTYFDGYAKENFKKIPGDYLEIVKYRASYRVIIFHIVIVIFLCYYLTPIPEKSYWETIVDSELLLAIHNLALLITLDELIPTALFHTLNKFIYIRKKYIDWTLRHVAK